MEVEAKVIYDSKQGDILNQFVTFTKVFDQQRKLYPDDKRLAVQETIRICREQDVLKDYLEGEEAIAVMFTFADQEREFNRALREERIAGEASGEARGEARGEIKGAIKTYRRIGKLPTEIIGLIRADFDLNQDEAEKYVEETLGLQLA